MDEKTDKKLVVPETIKDAEALMNNYELLNGFYPSLGAQSDDDFYLLYDYWNSIDIVGKNNYVWEKENYNLYDWQYLYQMVLNTNIALETLEKVPQTSDNLEEWKQVKGEALFFRAYAFYQLAQYFAIPYDKSTADQNQGIPLRLTSDVNIKTVRAGLQQTYDQIIKDYKEASQLLPVISQHVSLPSRTAAYAALSRTFLTMGSYSLAENFADSSLRLYNTLIDYNTLDSNSQTPFTMFNQEVIFPSRNLGSGMLTISNWNVDSVLYQSYGPNDLRKSLFYESNGPNTLGFKGNYDGTSDGNFFNGIAVDEVYLIRAESKARLGDMEGAMNDLNTLLVTRWKNGTYIPYVAATANDALLIILNERRKELVLRGLRWFDLRRLNKDAATAKTLTRILNGLAYKLPPNDPRYTFYIPPQVIETTGITQNKR
ncbi:MAG: RagB/SusD family nutrient uptake outer membrane protein [Ferruginibacter sp.]